MKMTNWMKDDHHDLVIRVGTLVTYDGKTLEQAAALLGVGETEACQLLNEYQALKKGLHRKPNKAENATFAERFADAVERATKRAKLFDLDRIGIDDAKNLIDMRHQHKVPDYVTKEGRPREWIGESNLAERELAKVKATLEYRSGIAAKIAKAWHGRKPGTLWCDIGAQFKISGNEALVLYEGWAARMMGTVEPDERYALPIEKTE